MEFQQGLIFAILAITVALFLSGRWRHDMIALASLLACVLVGLVPTDQAFSGFGHPAVITVACVLVLSQALQATGAVDVLAMKVLPKQAGPTVTISALTALAAILSAFMNNVGALALLMPIAIQVAARIQLAPGQVLMPLAFGSILGGMTTLIGTPPNLIVSGFRAETAERGFAMFDYSPVGVLVALVGVAFVALIGWRLVPARSRADASSFDTGKYLTEVRITSDSKLVNMPLRDFEKKLEELDAQVVGIVRNNYRAPSPPGYYRLVDQDVLIIEADPESLGALLSNLGLSLEESPANQKDKEVSSGQHEAETSKDKEKTKVDSDSELHLQELAILPNSDLIGRTAVTLNLRKRFNIHLLALSRQGQRSYKRVRRTSLQAGDVILMQGQQEALAVFATDFGCVPLAERQIRVPEKRNTLLASFIMLGAISGAAFGLLPAAISFAAGMLAIMALKVMPLRKVYTAIDWPVIVLLACLIPVAGAMATTGAADMLAHTMLYYLAGDHAILALVLILVLTMTLSDFMNNAATAAMMCPIAISVAEQLSVRADPFLMAVAIGASCAFLTPIGHQNNTLILGPGGFRFGDYWRLGLPMELVVIAVAIPALLLFWPL